MIIDILRQEIDDVVNEKLAEGLQVDEEQVAAIKKQLEKLSRAVLKKLLEDHFEAISTFTSASGVADEVQVVPGLGVGLNSLILELSREIIFWARDTCEVSRLEFDRQMHARFLLAMTTVGTSHQDPVVNYILQKIVNPTGVTLGYALHDTVPDIFDWKQLGKEEFFSIGTAVAREIVPDLRELLQRYPGMPQHPEITLEVVDQIMPENEVWPTFVPGCVLDYISRLRAEEIMKAMAA
jgi:hypothetical protein